MKLLQWELIFRKESKVSQESKEPKILKESEPWRTKKLVWIGVLICIHIDLLQAQAWSKADSLWLANMLAGKDTIRLNPEFQKAIQNGSFLNPDQPVGKMQMAPARIPLARDFSEYINDKTSSSPSDSTHRRVPLKDLPPSVFMRYGLDKPLPFNGIYRQAYTPYGRPAKSAATGISLSFDNLLQAAFSPSYRQKMRNRKHATAWRTYNDLPTPDIHHKQKKFRADHPELVLKPDTASRSPQTSQPPQASQPDTDTIRSKDTAFGLKPVTNLKQDTILAIKQGTTLAIKQDTMLAIKQDTTQKPDSVPPLKPEGIVPPDSQPGLRLPSDRVKANALSLPTCPL